MRIISGRFKGLALTPLGKGDSSAHLRPTTDRVRESLFSLLMGGRYGDPIAGSRVLDLFAGTGALGLEALSRGAAHVTFVENGRISLRLLDENIRKAKVSGETTVLKQDAARLGAAKSPVDLVFLDPPYGSDLGAKALGQARKGGWFSRDALIVFEADVPVENLDGFVAAETRRYGDTWLSFLHAN